MTDTITYRPHIDHYELGKFIASLAPYQDEKKKSYFKALLHCAHGYVDRYPEKYSGKYSRLQLTPSVIMMAEAFTKGNSRNKLDHLVGNVYLYLDQFRGFVFVAAQPVQDFQEFPVTVLAPWMKVGEESLLNHLENFKFTGEGSRAKNRARKELLKDAQRNKKLRLQQQCNRPRTEPQPDSGSNSVVPAEHTFKQRRRIVVKVPPKASES